MFKVTFTHSDIFGENSLTKAYLCKNKLRVNYLFVAKQRKANDDKSFSFLSGFPSNDYGSLPVGWSSFRPRDPHSGCAAAVTDVWPQENRKL